MEEKHRNEDFIAEPILFEEILTSIDKTLLSLEDEIYSVERNDLDFAGTKGPCVIQLRPADLIKNTDIDKTLKPIRENLNNSPSEDINRIAHEVSERAMRNKCELPSSPINSNDSFDSLRSNSPVELDTREKNKSMIYHTETNEVLGEIHSIPELLNPMDDVLLKSQTRSCQLLLNPEDLSDVEDNQKDSPCNPSTHCELESKTNDTILPHSSDFNSCNSSLDKSDKTKLNYNIDSCQTVKPCFVFLERCDSLAEEYLTKYPSSNPSTQLVDKKSKVSHRKVGHKSLSKCRKSNKSQGKLKIFTLSDDEVEPLPETSTNDSIETNVTQEEHPASDILDCNVDSTKTIPLGKIKEKNKKNIRRKRISSSSISDISSVSFVPRKKWKCNSSVASPENSQTLKIVIRSDDLGIDSDFSSSKENFKTSVRKKTKNVKVSSKFPSKPASESIADSVLELEKNYTSAKNTEDNFSDGSGSSLTSIISNQEAEQLDYSSVIKPCQVVLSRVKNATNISVASTSNGKGNYNVHHDWSDSSDLESDVEVSKPKQRAKEFNKPSEHEVRSSTEDPHDRNGRRAKKTPNSRSLSSIECDDSRNQCLENEVSDLNDSSSTQPSNTLPDAANGPEHLKKSRHRSKLKKSSSLKDFSPDTCGLKKSGTNKELLKYFQNGITQELKGIKKTMARTERKLNALLKLHEQVLRFL